MLRPAALLVLAAALSIVGCERSPSHPNVVIVSIDTLRADALGAYGGPLATPSFDRFASEGALFERVTAPSAETAPSHATLLTGRRVFEHGVRKNGMLLRAGVQTLAERFQASGYLTGAFVSSFVLDPRFGWPRGFETYDAEFPRDGETMHVHRIENPQAFWKGHEFEGFDRRGAETTRRAREWLADADEPFFLFVHYFDAHEPHRPPRAYRRRVARTPFDLRGRNVPGAAPRLVEQYVRDYHADVLYQDDVLGGLLEALDAKGLRERTIVAVTADHGQGLGQHGWLEHQVHLYDELVRVPLAVRWPGHAPAGVRIGTPVGLVDVAPTLAELAGLAPLAGEQGRSLAGALLRGESLEARPVYGYRRRYDEPFFGHSGEKLSVRTARWKLIRGSVDPDELFDLEADSQERENVLARYPDVAARLGALLDRWEASAPGEATAPALSDETRRGLEALGYTE